MWQENRLNPALGLFSLKLNTVSALGSEHLGGRGRRIVINWRPTWAT